MRVLTDSELSASCGSRAALARRFGLGAPAAELAISTLRAVRTLTEFLNLPNVTKEENVIFSAPEGDVHLDLSADGSDESVVMSSLDVTPRTEGS